MSMKQHFATIPEIQMCLFMTREWSKNSTVPKRCGIKTRDPFHPDTFFAPHSVAMPQKQQISEQERLRKKLSDCNQAVVPLWPRETTEEKNWRKKLLFVLLVRRGQCESLMEQLKARFEWLHTNAHLPASSSLPKLIEYNAMLASHVPAQTDSIPFIRQHSKDKSFVQDTLSHFIDSKWCESINEMLKTHRTEAPYVPGVLRMLLYSSPPSAYRNAVALITLEMKIAKVVDEVASLSAERVISFSAMTNQHARKLFWLVVHAYAMMCAKFDEFEVGQWNIKWFNAALNAHTNCGTAAVVRSKLFEISERCIGYSALLADAEMRLSAVTNRLANMRRSSRNPLIVEIVVKATVKANRDQSLLELRTGVPVERDSLRSLIVRLPFCDAIQFPQIEDAERFLMMAGILGEDPSAPPPADSLMAELLGERPVLSPIDARFVPERVIPPPTDEPRGQSPAPSSGSSDDDERVTDISQIDQFMDGIRKPFANENIQRENAHSLLLRYTGAAVEPVTSFFAEEAPEPPPLPTSFTERLQLIRQEAAEVKRSVAELAQRFAECVCELQTVRNVQYEKSRAQDRRKVLAQVKQITVMVQVSVAQMQPLFAGLLTERALAERKRVQLGVAAIVGEMGLLEKEMELVKAETEEVPRMQGVYDLKQGFLSAAQQFLPSVVFERPGCVGCNIALVWDAEGEIGFVPGAGLACKRCVPVVRNRLGTKPEYEVVSTVRNIRKALATPGCQMPIEYPFNGKTLDEMKRAFRKGGWLFLPSAMYEEDMPCPMCFGSMDWDGAQRPGYSLCCEGLGFICGACIALPHDKCGHALSVEYEIARVVGEVRKEVGI